MEFTLWVILGFVICFRILIISAYEIAKAICKFIEFVYGSYYKIINAFKVVLRERKKKALRLLYIFFFYLVT